METCTCRTFFPNFRWQCLAPAPSAWPPWPVSSSATCPSSCSRPETGVGANLHDFGHVRLFSPWRYNIDRAMAAQLGASGWQAPPPDELPLAREVAERVLQPSHSCRAVARALHLRTKVVPVSRDGFDKVKSAGRDPAPFVVRAVRRRQALGTSRPRRDRRHRHVAHTQPGGRQRPAGPRRARGASRIFYGIPDILGAHRARYAGQRVLVVGAGHSAANALLALAELADGSAGHHARLGVRTPVLDARVRRRRCRRTAGARRARRCAAPRCATAGRSSSGGLRITELRAEGGRLLATGFRRRRHARHRGVDEMVCATGPAPGPVASPSELRVKLDPWLESTEALGPLIDPNVHSCGTVRPHGAPRAGASRAGLLHRGREELWPRADLPDGDRLRAGALGGRGDRGRPGGGGSRGAGAARDRRLQHGPVQRIGGRLLCSSGAQAFEQAVGASPSAVGGRHDAAAAEMPLGRPGTVAALGTAQTLAWASSYYLPAMLAASMARDLGVSVPTVFAAFSLALGRLRAARPAGRRRDRPLGRPAGADGHQRRVRRRPRRAGPCAGPRGALRRRGSCSASAWAAGCTRRPSRRSCAFTAATRAAPSPASRSSPGSQARSAGRCPRSWRRRWDGAARASRGPRCTCCSACR